MPVEFIGMIATQEASEVRPLQGPPIHPDFTARFARAHEDSGFDRILIGYGSRWPDGWQVANHAVRATVVLREGRLAAEFRMGLPAPRRGHPHLPELRADLLRVLGVIEAAVA